MKTNLSHGNTVYVHSVNEPPFYGIVAAPSGIYVKNPFKDSLGRWLVIVTNPIKITERKFNYIEPYHNVLEPNTSIFSIQDVSLVEDDPFILLRNIFQLQIKK